VPGEKRFEFPSIGGKRTSRTHHPTKVASVAVKYHTSGRKENICLRRRDSQVERPQFLRGRPEPGGSPDLKTVRTKGQRGVKKRRGCNFRPEQFDRSQIVYIQPGIFLETARSIAKTREEGRHHADGLLKRRASSVTANEEGSRSPGTLTTEAKQVAWETSVPLGKGGGKHNRWLFRKTRNGPKSWSRDDQRFDPEAQGKQKTEDARKNTARSEQSKGTGEGHQETKIGIWMSLI